MRIASGFLNDSNLQKDIQQIQSEQKLQNDNINEIKTSRDDLNVKVNQLTSDLMRDNLTNLEMDIKLNKINNAMEQNKLVAN